MLGDVVGVVAVEGVPDDRVTRDILQHLREMLPCAVRVMDRVHPLCGSVLEARGFRHLRGELMLAVVLPDGSAGVIPAAATEALGETELERGPATVLTADGVRRLRVLLEAKSRGSGSRGTRRRAA